MKKLFVTKNQNTPEGRTPPSEKKEAARSVANPPSNAIPVKFHSLSEEEKAVVLKRMGAGEVVFQGPDHHVVEVKK